jgi:LysM repeat protein
MQPSSLLAVRLAVPIRRTPGLVRLTLAPLTLALLTTAGCTSIRARFSPPPSPLPASTRSPVSDSGASTACRENSASASRVHVVEPGESLSTIAAHYRVSALDLFAKNEIPDPDRIEVGQRLLLPANAIVPPEPAARSIPRAASRGPSARAKRRLADAEEHYRAARFEQALAASREASLLMQAESDRSRELARAAFLAGSALAGLGDEQRASDEFRRARQLDARFAPPEGWLSPGLAALYREKDATTPSSP